MVDKLLVENSKSSRHISNLSMDMFHCYMATEWNIGYQVHNIDYCLTYGNRNKVLLMNDNYCSYQDWHSIVVKNKSTMNSMQNVMTKTMKISQHYHYYYKCSWMLMQVELKNG